MWCNTMTLTSLLQGKIAFNLQSGDLRIILSLTENSNIWHEMCDTVSFLIVVSESIARHEYLWEPQWFEGNVKNNIIH